MPLKVALLDQTRVAGLGNIHAAEALYRARLHPSRQVSSLKPPELKRLAKGIHDTIAFAIAQDQGAEEIEYVEEPDAENPFWIYGRRGEKCRNRCGATVKTFTQGGRTTYFCPRCQPLRGFRRSA
jgi:formamidopyrimidine-DNA glycosylase